MDEESWRDISATAALTLIMVAFASRFVEYFPAFALLFCAAAWGRGDLPASIPAQLRSRTLAAIGGVLVVVVFSAFYLRQSYHQMRRADTPALRAGASAWLRDNTPEGTLVFNRYWDEFPRLFYHNSHNAYVAGLDPTYLQRANPELWTQYRAIIRGRVENPVSTISALYGAEYVIIDLEDPGLLQQLKVTAGAELVYEDEDSAVWKLTSESG